MRDLIVRFFVGGLLVSLFATLGDVLKPKSFAGLFGAAPSVALATLTLAILDKGNVYAATEARSMIAGAGAFAMYAWVCSQLMLRHKKSAMPVTLAGLGIWLGCALLVWSVLLR
jgi:hypothetical protein